MSRRTEKVASQLKEEVARILREEATDPRVRLVTITRVDVAPDLSHAVLFYSAMTADAEDASAIEQVDEGLHSAAGFLRRRAARALPLKRMPELRFRYDPSLALGTRTLGLLRELESGRAERDEAAAVAGEERSEANGEE
ncbi:MAG TPA: 30S ribosome-binding factor RbfA, partial [Myxococcota bacterium]